MAPPAPRPASHADDELSRGRMRLNARWICEHTFVSELLIYDQHGGVARRIAMAQDQRDPTKWRLAEDVALGQGKSERAFIFLDGREPIPLAPSLFPTKYSRPQDGDPREGRAHHPGSGRPSR